MSYVSVQLVLTSVATMKSNHLHNTLNYEKAKQSERRLHLTPRRIESSEVLVLVLTEVDDHLLAEHRPRLLRGDP